MRTQGHHPSPSEQSLPVSSGLDRDGKARLLLLGSQTPLPSAGFCSGPAGSGLVPQRGLPSAAAECQVGNGEKGVRAPRAPSLGFCVLRPPTLSSPSPAGLFLSACSTRAGGQGARLRSLLLSVGPKQPSLAPHQFVNPERDEEQAREFQVVAHTLRLAGGCAVRAADRASTGAWCPLAMKRLATHAGPGHVGHDGQDPGLSHKDQGPVRRLSQQAVSVAVTGHPGPQSRAGTGFTLATPWRPLFAGHYRRPWLHGQPSQSFRCADSHCPTEEAESARSLRLEMETVRLPLILRHCAASDVCRQ